MFAFQISGTINPEYKSQSVLLFLPPTQSTGVNPYTVLPLGTVTESARYTLTSQSVLRQVTEQGLQADIGARTDPNRPILGDLRLG